MRLRTSRPTLNENESSEEVAADPNATPPVVSGFPGLVEVGTVVGDASAGVTANDGDTLIYSLVGEQADVFEIDEDSGIIKVGEDGISDTTGGPDDDPATDDEDAKYTRSSTDNGKLVDDTDEFSDITYTFQVKVTDGISANDKYIDAKVTLEVKRAFVED